MSFDKFVNDIKTLPEMTKFSIDLSGHDNSVSEVTIVVAFSMLRCCLPES